MNTILEKEKFDATKELSEIQMAVSEGLANLAKIKDETEEYVVLREKKAEERIAKILKESNDALANISKNQDTLVQYRAELQAYANDINNRAKEVITLFKNFRVKMDKADDDIEKHYDEIRKVKKEIRVMGTQVEAERKQLSRERVRIENETRLLVDRRETLDRGFKELRRLKNKK